MTNLASVYIREGNRHQEVSSFLTRSESQSVLGEKTAAVLGFFFSLSIFAKRCLVWQPGSSFRVVSINGEEPVASAGLAAHYRSGVFWFVPRTLCSMGRASFPLGSVRCALSSRLVRPVRFSSHLFRAFIRSLKTLQGLTKHAETGICTRVVVVLQRCAWSCTNTRIQLCALCQ